MTRNRKSSRSRGCVRASQIIASRRDDAPAVPNSRTGSVAKELIIVQVPNRCLACAGIVKQMVGSLVAIEIGDSSHTASNWKRRAGCLADAHVVPFRAVNWIVVDPARRAERNSATDAAHEHYVAAISKTELAEHSQACRHCCSCSCPSDRLREKPVPLTLPD